MGNLEETAVSVCMGSSCFSFGSSRNADEIQQFIQDNGLEGKVSLSSSLCCGRCKNGPVIKINGELIEDVFPEMVSGLLSSKLLHKDAT